jgi:hemerythrin-like domain-containing protein
MTDLFETLVEEHRVIGGVLGAFERFIAQAEAGGALQPHALARFTTFFREYADLIHHEKEEALLFPAMERRGFRRDAAPIAHVQREHAKERSLLFMLIQVSVQTETPSETMRERFVVVAREYTAFVRQHMAKENELLYPRVREAFAGGELKEIVGELAAVLELERRVGETSWLRDLALELEESYPEIVQV